MATPSVTNTFVDATAAEASEVNANFQDLVTFLATYVLHLDGTKTMTAALPMGGYKITGLGTPSAGTDAATKAYVDTAALPVAGGTMTGAIAMGSSKITGLGAASADTDALSRVAGDARFVQIAVPAVDVQQAVDATGATLPTSWGDVATLTFTMPSGWTEYTLVVFGGATYTTLYRVYARARIGAASTGGETEVYHADSSLSSHSVAGLTGATTEVALQAYCSDGSYEGSSIIAIGIRTA